MLISYLIAAHNEESILEKSVERLIAYLEPFPFKKIYLIDNASTDRTFSIAKHLEQRHKFIVALQEPKAGMGYAHHHGMEVALATERDERHWIVLNSADIPFGNSDLYSFLRVLDKNPQFVIGSKSHPESKIEYAISRKILSRVYRLLRKLILGMQTKDSQGSLFIRADLARSIHPKTSARDFFHMTELVYWAEQAGIQPLEVPVVYPGSQRPSKVRPFQDSAKMLVQLLRVRYSH